LSEADDLDGADILPHFRLSVRQIFAEVRQQPDA
jgi:hypothetical protein